MEKNFLKTVLHRIRQIHLALRDLCVRLARFPKIVRHVIGKMPRQVNRAIL